MSASRQAKSKRRWGVGGQNTGQPGPLYKDHSWEFTQRFLLTWTCVSCGQPQSLGKMGNAVFSWEHCHGTKTQSSINTEERENGFWGKQLASSTESIYIYIYTINKLDKATNPQTIAREKLITMIIILILPLFAEHLYFSKYVLWMRFPFNILNKIVKHEDIDVSRSRNSPRKAESMINRNRRGNNSSMSLKLLLYHNFFLAFDLHL